MFTVDSWLYFKYYCIITYFCLFPFIFKLLKMLYIFALFTKNDIIVQYTCSFTDIIAVSGMFSILREICVFNQCFVCCNYTAVEFYFCF